jgi:Tol biopolymer transport system component
MQLAWFARDGRRIANVGPAGDYADVQLSPDEGRALVTRVEPKTATSNIWAMDLSTGVSSPLTFDAFVSAQPVWSPDGRDVVFRSQNTGGLARRLVSGAGGSENILRPRESLPDAPNVFPSDWSADGRFILFHGTFRDTGYDVWVLPLTGDRKPRPFVRTRAADMHARFSPDGRYVAYSSAESGRAQIYVQPFPAADGRWQLSTEGGAEPRWRGDGRELFFIGADRRLMAVPVKTTGAFEHGAPVPLFTTRVADFANPYRTSYAVSRDGQRFLISGVAENATPPSITVVVNWPGLVKR